MVLQRVVKAKTKPGKRFLESREPKLKEDVKTCMVVRGATASGLVQSAAKDLHKIKQPNSVLYSKKNAFLPFEDATSLEFFSQKGDASLFMFSSHNKKRPHNLTFGRMFNHQLLDMVEFGVENYKALQDFKVEKVASGGKPMLSFHGEIFDQDPTYQRIKNLFIDFFRGPNVEAIRLQGLEHVLQFTAVDGKIYFRSYKVFLKKSGTRIPTVEMEEIGPRMDFVLRRTKLASDSLFKLARKEPVEMKPRKKKNMSRSALGTRFGRVHMERQDYKKLQTRKLKALKKTKLEKRAARKTKQRAAGSANQIEEMQTE